MSCTPCTNIHQLFVVLLSLPEAFIPQRVSKNKLRHVKNSRSLSEQTLIQSRPHPVCQIERSSKKLFKVEDFGREPEQGHYTRQKVGCWLQKYFPFGGSQRSIWQIKRMVLIRWFLIDWFKILLSGELRLRKAKPRFDEVGLSISDSIWELSFCFWQRSAEAAQGYAVSVWSEVWSTNPGIPDSVAFQLFLKIN